MVDLNKLSPKELQAAMQQGHTVEWGRMGSSATNVRYSIALPKRRGRRRKCHCGCDQPVTHAGMANGMALTNACELGIARWVRTGRSKPSGLTNNLSRPSAAGE